MNNSSRKRRYDLLLVDNDAQFRRLAAEHFCRQGYRVHETESGEQAMEIAHRRAFDVAVVDVAMPDMPGFDLLEQLKKDSECQVVLLSGHGTIETAVAAMKRGAYDFLTKPVELAELEAVVEKAGENVSLRKENSQWRTLVKRSETYSNMIGHSPPMRDVYRLIERTGPTNKPVLIQGESGTGKELVARALHQVSPRADKPMVVVNCAALPEMLLESELFGHEKGSYTGATNAKPGLFEVADGGTLFIDEIGEMASGVQAKLLRVLEDGSLRRVGALKERRVDVRLLTATNRDLTEEVKQGRFREDLYYRIDVMRLQLPPLRDRFEDVRLMAHFFAGDEWSIDADAMQAIEEFDWPGNVRQLINAIERAKVLVDDQKITLQNLPAEIAACAPTSKKNGKVNSFNLESLKRHHVETVMSQERGNKSRAARALGVSRRSLYRLLDKYDLALA